MFGSGSSATPGRYEVQLVSGELREKTHQRNVQQALNEGASRGWRLVSASTTNTAGSWITSLYWDTSLDRT